MKKDKRFFPLTALCTMAYFVSYLTRLNYQVINSEIAAKEGLDVSLISIALTGLFIAYGVGQLLSGLMGDKMDPRLLVFTGLAVSSAINILMPLFTNVTVMTVLWTINGFSQALIWPPMVKILSSNLNSREYARSAFWVSCGSSFGTILIYILAPACITLAGWRSVFFVCAAFGVIGAAVWLSFTMKMKLEVPARRSGSEKIEEKVQNPPSSKKPVWLWMVFGALFLILITEGLLRDGITTWTPYYLMESFQLLPSQSILISVGLPIFSIFSYSFAAFVLRKCKDNEPWGAMMLYALFTAISLILFFFGQSSIVLAAATLMLCSGLAHGVNYVLIAVAPRRFIGKNGASISGFLNFSVYVGSAISTFGFASLSKSIGWNFTVLAWVFIAVFGGVLCALLIKIWKERLMKNN